VKSFARFGARTTRPDAMMSRKMLLFSIHAKPWGRSPSLAWVVNRDELNIHRRANAPRDVGARDCWLECVQRDDISLSARGRYVSALLLASAWWRILHISRHLQSFWPNRVIYARVKRRVDGCVAQYRALKHKMQFKLSLFIVGKQYLRPLRAVSALANVNITTVHDSSQKGTPPPWFRMNAEK